jgi:hypothetical protein
MQHQDLTHQMHQTLELLLWARLEPCDTSTTLPLELGVSGGKASGGAGKTHPNPSTRGKQANGRFRICFWVPTAATMQKFTSNNVCAFVHLSCIVVSAGPKNNPKTKSASRAGGQHPPCTIKI